MSAPPPPPDPPITMLPPEPGPVTSPVVTGPPVAPPPLPPVSRFRVAWFDEHAQTSVPATTVVTAVRRKVRSGWNTMESDARNRSAMGLMLRTAGSLRRSRAAALLRRFDAHWDGRRRRVVLVIALVGDAIRPGRRTAGVVHDHGDRRARRGDVRFGGRTNHVFAGADRNGLRRRGAAKLHPERSRIAASHVER